ncbi:MAG: hypothetical protein ACI4MK_01870 [Aristaeellaceae bacterium]
MKVIAEIAPFGQMVFMFIQPQPAAFVKGANGRKCGQSIARTENFLLPDRFCWKKFLFSCVSNDVEVSTGSCMVLNRTEDGS